MTGSTTNFETAAVERVVLALGSVETSEELSSFLKDEKTLFVSAKSLNDVVLQQQRVSISRAASAIESLVIVMQASEIGTVYNNPLELANWVPSLRSDSSIELRIFEGEIPSSNLSLQAIHTSFLLAGLKAASEEQQHTQRILRAERKKKTSTQSQPIQIKESFMLQMNHTDDTSTESDDSTSATVETTTVDRVVLALGNTEKSEDVSSFSKNEKTMIVFAKSLNDVVLQQRRKEISRDDTMFESLVVLMQSSEVALVYNNPLELANWVPLLRSDSSIELRIFEGGTSHAKLSLQPIHTSFLLAGLKATSEEQQPTQRVLRAERKKKTSTQSQPIQIKESSIFRINLNDATITDDEDDDSSSLMDEDELLNDDAFTPSLVAPNRDKMDDCAGRKPCDNCSCGRAEVYADSQNDNKKQKWTKKEVVSKSSACGNCPKGDAFRCASCPFLGKAAFKAGEEHLVLDLVDDF